jgi:iron complex outermembrane receptor protein
VKRFFVLIFFYHIISYSYELPEIKVFGDKLEQNLKDSFANLEVITKERIEEISPTDTYDIINYINGSTLKSYDRKHTNIDLRGFGEKGGLNNLILLNGMRLNATDMSGVDLSTIPVDSIERVEVYHGGNSVLFGDRAIGGVINIITKKPTKSGFNVKSDFGSYNYENYYTDGVYANENFSLMLNANRNRTDGYRNNSGFDANSIGGESAYFGENLEFNISGSYSDSDYGLPGGLSKNDLKEYGRRYSAFPNDGGGDKEGYVTNRVKLFLPIGDFVVNGDYRNRNRDYDVSGLSYDDELTYYSMKPQYILSFNNTIFNNKVQLGYDFEQYDVSIKERTYENNSKLRRTYHGIYIFDTFKINKFTIQAGYRKQYKKDLFKIENDSRKDWPDSYLFMIAYTINKNHNLYIKYDRSFRFPTTDELMEYGGKLNDELKPQKTHTIEGGYKFIYKEYYANLVAFYQKTDDEVFTNPEAIYYNEGFYNTNFNTKRFGISINSGVSNKYYLVDLKYSYINGSIDEHSYNNVEIPLVSKHSVKGLFGYKSPFGFNIYYTINYNSSYYAGNDYLNEAKKIDGYFVSDIKCEYNYKFVSAYFKINNLFDEKYYDYTYYSNLDGYHYYPSNTRNWVTGVSIKF